MKRHIHGTTNTCVPCENGIIIGNEARISNSYQTKEGTAHEIISDEEVKLFQLYSEPNMYCTLMGDVEEWHKMYKHLLDLEPKPKSIMEAVDAASEYLTTYKNNNRRGSFFEVFGTIIAGYEEKKGFEYYGVTVSKKDVSVNRHKIIAIGSGSGSASKILEKTQKYPPMTRQTAVSMTLKALMEGCFDDIATGFNLKVTFVHSNGCISDTYQLLEVYSALYEPSDKEKATLLLIYSTSMGPIFGHNQINKLICELGLTNLKFSKHNIIAKKKCFYITRIELKGEADATKVYAFLSNKNDKPLFPVTLAHVRNYLIDCITNTNQDHIYVGRSSKQLLEGLTKLQDADTFKS